MDGIYEWIRSMVFYLIFMTMIFNLLPDKRYEKYLQLFAGVVFLLLMFGPFADITGIEAQVTGAFERITFQNDAKLLKREIEDMDGKRAAGLADAYKKAVAADLMTMTEGGLLECRSVDVALETDMESSDFGRVMAVNMRVGIPGAGEDREQRLSANREIGNLKKRIGEYYGLEERKITIHLENE